MRIVFPGLDFFGCSYGVCVSLLRDQGEARERDEKEVERNMGCPAHAGDDAAATAGQVVMEADQADKKTREARQEEKGKPEAEAPGGGKNQEQRDAQLCQRHCSSQDGRPRFQPGKFPERGGKLV